MKKEIHTEKKESNEPKKKEKKSKIKPIVFLVIIFTAIFYGYKIYQKSVHYEETDNAYVFSHIYPISSKIGGSVAKVSIKDNQHVKKGDVLLELDPTDYEINVMKAKSALEVSRKQSNVSKSNIHFSEKNYSAVSTQASGNVQVSQAGVEVALSAVKEAQEGLSASVSQIEQVKANLTKANNDYNRYKELVKSGAASSQQLDLAKASFDSLVAQKQQMEQLVNQNKARLLSAKENVQKARAQVFSSQGSIEQANATGYQTVINKNQYDVYLASIKQAEVNLKEALNQLSYTKITAPADGNIGKRTVEDGQRLQAGQLLMSVVGDETWIVANFKETQLDRIKKNQEVEIKLDSFPKHLFKGKVDSFSRGTGAVFALLPPDNATGNFTKIVQRIPVKIVFDKESIKEYKDRIGAGMSAIVSIKVK